MQSRNLEDKEQLNNERKKWVLSLVETQKNIEETFQELVISGDAKTTDRPSIVMVGGQAGSGKSLLCSYYLKKLNGGAIMIDQDYLRLKHPNYTEIHDMYTEREEFLILKRYLDSLINGIVNKASDLKYNIILESALRSIDKFATLIQDIATKGLRTELAVLAIDPEEANLSMFIRYCEYLETRGECRRNTRIDSDSVKKIPVNIQTLNNLQRKDGTSLMDDIKIFTRGNASSDFLPIERYSRKIEPNMLPSEAYRKFSTEKTITTEEKREKVNWIRNTLTKFGEERVLSNFDKWENSTRTSEGQAYDE
ncbi:MAG: zeta toxin family protein [Clostridia bacterium]|nr:zeta toxin family protein [Clostridia bacterium]